MCCRILTKDQRLGGGFLMTIEDIDFLQHNGIKENKVIFVDSATRDKQAYQTPAEYVINFVEPFTNVFGLEILDASIPRTLYNIDKHNNTLFIGIGRNPKNTSIRVELDDRDFETDELIGELNSKMNQLKDENDATLSHTLTTSNLGTGKTRMRFESDSYPFVLDMTRSTIAENLGFDEFAVDGHPDYLKIRNDSNDNPRLFGSRSIPGEVSSDTPVHGAYYSTVDIGEITPSEKNDKFLPVYRGINVAQEVRRSNEAEGHLHRITIQIKEFGTATVAEANLKCRLFTSFGGNQPAALVREFPFLVDTYDPVTQKISTDILSDDDFDLTTLVTAQAYWFVFVETTYTDEANSIGILINTTINSQTEGANYDPNADIPNDNIYVSALYNPATAEDFQITYTLQNLQREVEVGVVVVTEEEDGSQTTVTVTEKRNYKLYTCFNYQLIKKIFFINAPGLLNLTGERFILLRCPEIENYVYGSVAYGNNSPGLALFKMGVVGYADTRFDFASIQYKEFHPIGKLSRLTLRFERTSGDLYDFKGVNHHLLLVIRTLIPKSTERVARSTLNPNYTPNFLEHMRQMEEKETSSLEDDDDDELNYRDIFFKKERAYLEDSDEDLRYLPPAFVQASSESDSDLTDDNDGSDDDDDDDDTNN
jgi:hypothetical protein